MLLQFPSRPGFFCAWFLLGSREASKEFRWRARGKSVGRNRIARSGEDSVGRVAADGKAGAYYAGDFKGCGRSNEL